MIELLFLGGAAFAGAAHTARQHRAARPTGPARRTRGGRAGGWAQPHSSLLVKAWKSAGAPHTDEEHLPDAIADLGGRALGKLARGTGRTAGRKGRQAGRWAHNTAERRWNNRPPDSRTTFFARRSQSTGGRPGNPPPANAPTPNGAAPRRQGTPPPLFGSPGPRAGAPVPGSAPSVPPTNPGAASPRTQPAARPAGGPAPAKPSPPKPPPPPGQRRRAHARIWAAGPPINLDPPTSDAEFIETSTDLQQFLLGVAAAVEDYTAEVMIRRMPAAVTLPLEQVGEEMVEASAAVQRGAMVFEVVFEEAIDLAAAGIKFTGSDPD
ncbi:hypothetical protein [Actinomadura hibisca]|uniref:hypothetical protein n=1 Tax=Actinomadura hibisca TaxID=68565 RepID=UPI000ACA95C9|nr:hypothetical protein [Actinomadura hibisca]